MCGFKQNQMYDGYNWWISFIQLNLKHSLNSIMKKKFILTSLFSLAVTSVYGSLVISSLETPSVIDFQSNVGWTENDNNAADNVFKFSTGLQRDMIERESFAWGNGDNWGFSADAWQYMNTSINGGAPTGFENFNGDADLLDDASVLNALNLAQHSIFGTNNWGVILSGTLGTNEGDNAWSNSYLTLRIQNTTGIAVNEWSFTMDAWMNDASGNNFSNLTLQYSTDNTSFTTFDTVVGAATSGWASQGSIGGAIDVTVENNGFLYVKIDSLRVAGNNGTGFAFDNIAVTAVPEPSTWAFIIGFPLLGLLIYRRKGI